MIHIRDLQKNYGDFRLAVSLDIPEGRVSGIVGRNGSGKSTLIKSILGLVRPDAGTVTVFGKDPFGFTAEDKARVGVAFSDSGFSAYLTVSDVVAILKNTYPGFDAAAFRSACEKGGLPFDKRISAFSTGMKAKLRVLVACSHRAKLLILDEPTAGLDVIARREVLDLLRACLAEDESRSMLISSHISGDLEGVCDDIYMLSDGKIVLHEETYRILGEYAVLKLSKARFDEIDKTYIRRVKEEPFGVSCLTDEKRFYAENYPDIVIESGGIDEMIVMMTEGGEQA